MMEAKKCSVCEAETKNLTKGMCKTCYMKDYFKKKKGQELKDKYVMTGPPVEQLKTIPAVTGSNENGNGHITMSVDLTDFKSVYDRLLREAKDEIRLPEQQVVWILKKHFAEVS